MPYAHNGVISQGPLPGGIEITEAQYAEALNAMLLGNQVSIEGGFQIIPGPAPDTPPPTQEGPQVPQEVTAAQGGIALIQAGLMGAVQAAVDAPDTPAEVKWAWSRATSWHRHSPGLLYLATKAGITSQQMDDLFTAAAQIVA